jgi:hypothetical protein
MLGKAEYVKYTLRSICEERIRYFLSNKVIDSPQYFIQSLKNSPSVESFLNESGWYQDFIDRIPVEYESLYRFAAFVSDNIGNLKKDKFDIKKEDGTAKLQAETFIEKSKLNEYQKVPGEWHLQKIFIQEVQKLKESL